MRTRAKILVAAAVLATAGLASWWRSPDAGPAPLELRFAPGTEYTYALSWQSQQATRVGDGRTLAGRIDLRGRLIVRAYTADDRGSLIGLAFDQLQTHDVEIADRAVVDDADTAAVQLAASEALVEVGRDGTIETISFDPRAPALFVHLASMLASQLEFRFGDGERWYATSPGPFGESTARYTRNTDGVARSREAYTTLAIVGGGGATGDVDARATLAIASAGHWTRISDTEHVRLRDGHGAERADAGASLALELIALRAQLALAPPATTGRDRRRPGPSIAPDAAADRKALLDKVGGLSRADLLGGLSSEGAIANVERWIWRATGLLELDPALAAELGELVATRRLTDRSAELALDLLASTGTPEAQAALRTALASSSVRAAASYGLLVQRLSVVARPTPETAAFAGELYGHEGRPEVAYALGAVIRHLADADVASRWNAVLAGDLEHAADPRRQTILLGAIGNAARPENVDLVARHADSRDADVRAATARALRHTDVPRAREVLHVLAGDRAVAVQREALGALARHRLGAGDLASLERTFATSDIGAGNESAVVALVAGLDAVDAGANLLRAIAARSSTLPELRARIEVLLARHRRT